MLICQDLVFTSSIKRSTNGTIVRLTMVMVMVMAMVMVMVLGMVIGKVMGMVMVMVMLKKISF